MRYLIKILLITITSFILPIIVLSQDKIENYTTPRGNSIYFEYRGSSGYYYSINYEKIVFNNPQIAIRGGFGYKPSFKFSIYSPQGTIPLETIYIIGKKHHFFEVGLGASYLFTHGKHSYGYSFTIFSRIGYRLLLENGFIFKVGFTPVYEPKRYFYEPNGIIMPYGGICLGYSF